MKRIRWARCTSLVVVVLTAVLLSRPQPMRADGPEWVRQHPTLDCKYSVALWGSPSVEAGRTELFAVCTDGIIQHYDGTHWSRMDAGHLLYLYDVWGSASDDVFVVGWDGTILHYDGSDWSAMDSGTTATLHEVWGHSGLDVYAVGEGGTILHYDGSGWSAMNSGVSTRLYGLWGDSNGSIFAAGDGGTILYRYAPPLIPVYLPCVVSSP